MDASVELAHKQALIDRLLDDVDKRANAVARCGQEIMELRALNKHQEQELQAQCAAAVGRERAIERLADDAANVDNIDMAELQRRHRLLAAAYRADRKRIEQLQALNQQYATSLSTQEQLQSAYATLKEAHKQQAAQMLRLQDEAKKVAKYRHTARQQEQIITRLEQLMQASLKDAKGARAQASCRTRTPTLTLTLALALTLALTLTLTLALTLTLTLASSSALRLSRRGARSSSQRCPGWPSRRAAACCSRGRARATPSASRTRRGKLVGKYVSK